MHDIVYLKSIGHLVKVFNTSNDKIFRRKLITRNRIRIFSVNTGTSLSVDNDCHDLTRPP